MVGTLAPFDAIAHERQQGCVLLLRRTEKRTDMAVATKRRTSKGDRFTRHRHDTSSSRIGKRSPEGSCQVHPQSVERNRAASSERWLAHQTMRPHSGDYVIPWKTCPPSQVEIS